MILDKLQLLSKGCLLLNGLNHSESFSHNSDKHVHEHKEAKESSHQEENPSDNFMWAFLKSVHIKFS
jgi:hypothetical protein